MATKLKNLHLTSVDLVRAGANQKADIRIHKSADDPENPEEGIFKRFLKWLRDEPSAAQEVPAEPIEKDSSTFNQINNNRDLTDKLWRYTDALTCSLNSIRDDNDLDNGKKALMMKTSLRQFSTAMEVLIDDLCQTALLVPEAVGKSDANRFDEIEEVCKFNDKHDPKTGRFAPKNGGGVSSGGAAAVNGDKKEYTEAAGESSGGFSTTTPDKFAETIAAAKASQTDKDRWRVDAHDADYYEGSKLLVTPGGSTVAVKPDGDIISVCRADGDTIRGKELMKTAVENGGTKLDSFGGNHDFYQKCGFSPVSWTPFSDDPEIQPPGWKESGAGKEPVVFYRYDGANTKKISLTDFIANTEPCLDDENGWGYDKAMKIRDDSMK